METRSTREVEGEPLVLLRATRLGECTSVRNGVEYGWGSESPTGTRRSGMPGQLADLGNQLKVPCR